MAEMAIDAVAGEKRKRCLPDGNPALLPAPLTECNLKAHNRSLGIPSPAPTLNMSTTSSRSSRSINAYHPAYGSELRRRNIYVVTDEKHEPWDFAEFEDKLRRQRDSPPPNKEDIKEFRDQVPRATSEELVRQYLVPRIVQLERIFKSSDFVQQLAAQWDEIACIATPSEAPTLSKPKPDVALGWYPTALYGTDKAATESQSKRMGIVANAQPNMLFPSFTIETKGPKGLLDIAKLQNLYNAANIMFQKHRLWEAAKRAPGSALEDFFNKIRVVTLSFTHDTAAIRYHWAEFQSGEVHYLAKDYISWRLAERQSEVFENAYKTIRNAVEYALECSREPMLKCIANAERAVRGGHYTVLPTPSATGSGEDSRSAKRRKNNKERATDPENDPQDA